jgi:hypothetical protein
MKYVIESNVPSPKEMNHKKYPFGDMKVGDSFKFDRKDARRIRSASCVYAKSHGKKYSVSVKKTHRFGRIWRIK